MCKPFVLQRSGPASAQTHTLLLAHVSADKESLQLSFPLDVDEPSALAQVAQVLQNARRLLRHLDAEQI